MIVNATIIFHRWVINAISHFPVDKATSGSQRVVHACGYNVTVNFQTYSMIHSPTQWLYQIAVMAGISVA